MIEINLIPQEFKKAKSNKIAVGQEYLFSAGLLIAGVLACVHIYLGVVYLVKNYQLHALNRQWQLLQPQKKEVDVFRKENEALSADALMIKELARHRIIWAEKLNSLSLDLPSGIWLKEASAANNSFTLSASAIALGSQEMNLINKFINSLKKDPGFFGDFENLELTTAQRKVISGYDVVDFVLAGKLKQK